MAARDTFNMTTAGNNNQTSTSPWHSPVPYLFGGLAAMLGLIAFSLIVLACSYTRERQNRDLEAGQNDNDNDKEDGDSKKPKVLVLEEKFLVIMAGEVTPTFIATAVSGSVGTSRSSSFGENDKTCTCNHKLGESLEHPTTSDDDDH